MMSCILWKKIELSNMKSKSAFLRAMILYGYVYDVDYSFLQQYNTELGRISSNLNQIVKRTNATEHMYACENFIYSGRVAHYCYNMPNLFFLI